MRDLRKLEDLSGVGKATLADLQALGIRSVAALAEESGADLYERLCRLTGVRPDICCLDVFHCAVEQARDPHLSREKCNWWYWSRLRKSREKKGKDDQEN
jgi:nucleotidyltransferase/DNA polymerase involved in DNA repair